MIFLIHDKSNYVAEVYRNTERIPFSANICKNLFDLAERFPEEFLVWVEKDLYSSIEKHKLIENFDHDLVMISYAVKTKFLSGEIGYVDQLPFINVPSGVKYPSWRMSSDIGGIKGNTLLRFKKDFGNILDFNYLLNSIAKVGQQNGLFCYSHPGLVKSTVESEPVATADTKYLFSFVYQNYNTIWVFVLFFCMWKYEKKFPLWSLFRSFFNTKFFGKEVNLPKTEERSDYFTENILKKVDVIIPTIGRPEYLKQVVEDLSQQTLLPERVIIVEQQPQADVGSELENFLKKEWPFQVVHIFTHQTGACIARNKALEKVESEWIFFADDDIRLTKEIFAETLDEASRLGVNCINLNCKQPGEETTFHKVKQWGSFGSGTSLVRSKFAKDLRFSEVFEHGYGEDADFGMKLRGAGCDIIYHPDLEIQHLKAPIGGFRKKPVLEWEKENPQPKPSPTVMILAKRYFTPRQIKGFKISLYLKFFRNQKEKNPVTYFRNMEKSWKKSEEWAKKLEGKIAIPGGNGAI